MKAYTKTDIINTLKELIEISLKCDIIRTDDDETNCLNIILNNSAKAIEFVSLIENEFDIELDDDDINLNFFSNINYISDIILKYV